MTRALPEGNWGHPLDLTKWHIVAYLCNGQIYVDVINGKRFQAQSGLLAICKVNIIPLAVQWNGWWFGLLARDSEHAKLIAEERWIR